MFTKRTSMGPVVLFRWIWYFFCPFRPWGKAKAEHSHSAAGLDQLKGLFPAEQLWDSRIRHSHELNALPNGNGALPRAGSTHGCPDSYMQLLSLLMVFPTGVWH